VVRNNRDQRDVNQDETLLDWDYTAWQTLFNLAARGLVPQETQRTKSDDGEKYPRSIGNNAEYLQREGACHDSQTVHLNAPLPLKYCEDYFIICFTQSVKRYGAVLFTDERLVIWHTKICVSGRSLSKFSNLDFAKFKSKAKNKKLLGFRLEIK